MTSDQNPNPAIDLDVIETSIIAILGVDFLPGIHALPAPSLPRPSTGLLPPRA